MLSDQHSLFLWNQIAICKAFLQLHFAKYRKIMWKYLVFIGADTGQDNVIFLSSLKSIYTGHLDFL